MSSKTIPFISKSQSASPLISKGPKKSDDGNVVDHGTLGTLDYEIYKRSSCGVIHIFDKKLRFKKDIDVFEKEVQDIDFEKMSDGEQALVKGSGDNDNLIFSRSNGDVVISLKKKGFAAIELLQSVFEKGKQKLAAK